MMASMASMATRAWWRRRGRGEVWLPRMIRLPAIETSSYETADDLDDAPPKACAVSKAAEIKQLEMQVAQLEDVRSQVPGSSPGDTHDVT